MAENNHPGPGFATLLRKLGVTALGAAENRGELFALELQEERVRVAELLIRIAGLLFFAMSGVLLLTASIIFLFPEHLRLYVSFAFTMLYLLAAIWAFYGLRSVLLQAPFNESLNQIKRDRAWLESLK